MKKESIKQTLKFGTVGLLNTLVDYVIFYILIAFVGANKTIAQVFATAVAMCGSYAINRRWTFGEHGRVKKRQILKFVVTNLVAMCCTILFMNFFHDVIELHEWVNTLLKSAKISFTLSENMEKMLCKVVASLLSMIVNFIGNKFWVFNANKAEKVE